MSRAQAIQTSKDRLVANMLVTIPAIAALVVIWHFQRPKAPAIEGYGPPELPL